MFSVNFAVVFWRLELNISFSCKKKKFSLNEIVFRENATKMLNALASLKCSEKC